MLYRSRKRKGSFHRFTSTGVKYRSDVTFRHVPGRPWSLHDSRWPNVETNISFNDTGREYERRYERGRAVRNVDRFLPRPRIFTVKQQRLGATGQTAAPLSCLPGPFIYCPGIALFARARHLATGHFAAAYTHSRGFPLSPFARGGSTDRLTLTVPVLPESHPDVGARDRGVHVTARIARAGFQNQGNQGTFGGAKTWTAIRVSFDKREDRRTTDSINFLPGNPYGKGNFPQIFLIYYGEECGFFYSAERGSGRLRSPGIPCFESVLDTVLEFVPRLWWSQMTMHGRS